MTNNKIPRAAELDPATHQGLLWVMDQASGLYLTPAVAAATYLAKASNLSDVANVATSRTNLGLGGAAVLNVGTTAGTVAAGDDSRFNPETINNANTGSVTANAADTYLTGSSVSLAGRVKAGTVIRWRLGFLKTAAGVAAPTLDVRFGAAGTTADTSRLNWTFGAQTAASDYGWIDLDVIVRSVSATGTVAGHVNFTHRNTATGFWTGSTPQTSSVVSGTFATNAGTLIAGLSMNPGASGVWTFEVVDVQAFNLT